MKARRRRPRQLWELKRELKRRLRKMSSYQANYFVDDLREYVITLNFFVNRDDIDEIQTHLIAKAYDARAIEFAIRHQGTVKR